MNLLEYDLDTLESARGYTRARIANLEKYAQEGVKEVYQEFERELDVAIRHKIEIPEIPDQEEFGEQDTRPVSSTPRKRRKAKV